MQQSLLEFLACPVCKSKLQLQKIKTATKQFKTSERTIVEAGLLLCSCDFLFPIIDAVPRLLVESFMDHEDFLSQNVPDFFDIKQALLTKYGKLIDAAQKRNGQTKASFSFEWSLLKNDEQNIWHLNKEEYKTQLFAELDLPEQFFANKRAIDVGCGHGRSTSLLGEKCKTVIGADLGLSVIKACADNLDENCHFIQADLHCLPFPDHSFDIVYSSGVLHHTPNTEEAFTIVARLTKRGGIYCVWLYRRYNNPMHLIVNGLRRITTHLPLRLQYQLYLIFLVPFHKLIAWVRGRKPRSTKEIMIDLFDSFSPRYRFEHEQEEVRSWFGKNGFTGARITTENKLGFSIRAKREIGE